MCCWSQKAWLLSWWTAFICVASIKLAYFVWPEESFGCSWLIRVHWNKEIKERWKLPDRMNVYKSADYHICYLGLPGIVDILESDKPKYVYLGSKVKSLVDPYCALWWLSYIFGYLSVFIDVVLVFLIMPTVFFTASCGCFCCSDEKLRKLYKKVRSTAQILSIISVVAMSLCLFTFAWGIENDLTTGNEYLNYRMYCRNPKPFQPDKCAFHTGFWNEVSASCVQVLVCLYSFVENVMKLEPIRKRRPISVWIDPNVYDNAKVRLVMERLQSMHQRMSAVSVRFSMHPRNSTYDFDGNNKDDDADDGYVDYHRVQIEDSAMTSTSAPHDYSNVSQL